MKLALQILAFLIPAGMALPALPPAPGGIFDVYERNRAEGVPNLITEDLMMTSYWLILTDAVTQYEEKKAAPALDELAASLLADKKLDPANRQFLELIQALLAGKSEAGSAEVDAELKRIAAAAGVAHSDLFRQQIDYSQFKVRGKYTRTEGLRRYFVASKTASAVLFPVLESAATGVSAADADEMTRRALDLVRAIDASAAAKKAYATLTSGLAFLFGPADDLTLDQYRPQQAKAPALARKSLLALGLRPAVNSAIVDTTRLEQGRSVADVTTGFRLLPQRFTADSAAFQQLVFDKVKNYKGSADPFTAGMANGKKVKLFPTALELMALQGSQLAASSLRASDDTNYEGYAAARLLAAKVMTRASGLNALHMAYLKKGFTVSDADHLTAALAFWTQDRYASILYAKQSYTAIAKGMILAPDRTGAWIDPRPAAFQDLAALATTVGKQIESKPMLDFAKEATHCATIAAAALKTKAISKADGDYLNGLDLVLLDLTGRKDAPLVIDVHTDGNSGMVLEEAIGFPRPAIKDKAQGGRFRHYEFKQPMAERLNDEAWTAMLLSGKLPATNAVHAKKTLIDWLMPAKGKEK